MSLHDEDVVIAGSVLHTHLVSSGFHDVELGGAGGLSDQETTCDHDSIEALGPDEISEYFPHRQYSKNVDKLKQVLTYILPSNQNKQDAKGYATFALDSGLLVVEDEEFFLHYLLADTDYDSPAAQPHPALLDSVLLSSCLAAAGVLTCSKRISPLSAALPVAVLTLCSLRTGTRWAGQRQAARLNKRMTYLLRNMKQFKVLLSKSLTLIRGMEMMNKSQTVAVKSGQKESEPSKVKNSNILENFNRQTLLIPLRQTVYFETYQMLLQLR